MIITQTRKATSEWTFFESSNTQNEEFEGIRAKGPVITLINRLPYLDVALDDRRRDEEVDD